MSGCKALIHFHTTTVAPQVLLLIISHQPNDSFHWKFVCDDMVDDSVDACQVVLRFPLQLK